MAVLQQIAVPLLAVNDTFLTVVEINFIQKAAVKKGDIVMVFETSKTTYEVIAEADGFIKLMCEAGNDYAVNDIVAEIYSSADEIVVEEKKVVVVAQGFNPVELVSKAAFNYTGTTLFSLAAQHLLQEKNISPDIFAGYEMVTAKDIQLHLNPNAFSTTAETIAVKASQPKKQNTVLPEGTTAIKLSNNKKREIEYLSAVQETGLTSTLAINISTNGLFGSVNKHLKYFKNSLLPLLVYETSRLLVKYPLLNGFFDNNQIYTYNEVNIGFAIDIDKGLKVVKVATTNELTVAQVEETILELSNQYLEDKIPIESLTGISFTVTDLSGEGVSYFRPLVNMYNSAIMGISAIDEELQRFNTSITFDHRITEGKYVAQFLNELKARMESYAYNDAEANNHIKCYKCFKTLQEDLAQVGLLPVITPQGKREHICQTCWNGL
jgi:pyruvate/2-oxoglutarate dehydrogenase complex dihydrolipoamide acyltransferase (E2) component